MRINAVGPGFINTPLLEKNMEVIADGRFEKIQIDSRDREIASLTNAFNKMLRELELRQRSQASS